MPNDEHNFSYMKSTAGVISEFTSLLEKHIFSPEEAIYQSPASFINLHMATLGKLSAYSWYESQMQKKEVNPSTALQLKSLIRHLDDEEIMKIYGKPATMTFILAFPEAEIIRMAVKLPNGSQKLTINKNLTATILDFPPFTLDHNIDMFVTRYHSGDDTYESVYAKFDTSDKFGNAISSIENPFITSRVGMLNGKKYFFMYLPMRQYDRQERIYEINGKVSDMSLSYDNYLCGFQLIFKALGSDVWKHIPLYPQGVNAADGPNYQIDQESKTSGGTIEIQFSKVPGNFNPQTGTLKLTVCSTSGTTGNFQIPNIMESIDDVNVNIQQDRSNVYEEALITLAPIASIQSPESQGGSDALNMEEIRSLIVRGTKDRIITPSEVERVANNFGYTSKKVRHDLESYEFRVHGVVKTGDIIIPTMMVSFAYLHNDTDLPLNPETNARMMTPQHVFKHNHGEKYCYKYTQDELLSFEKYIAQYNKNRLVDLMSPYYFKMENSKELKVTPYDLSVNHTQVADFEFINTTIIDKFSVLNVTVERNPMNIEIDEESGVPYANMYFIRFDVSTSDSMMDVLENDGNIVKFVVTIHNQMQNTAYALDAKLVRIDGLNKLLVYEATLKTDNAIDSVDNINIIKNSIARVPYNITNYVSYFIEPKIDIRINVLMKPSDRRPSSDYDDIIEPNIRSQYYVGLVYKIIDVEIVKNLSKVLTIYPDIQLVQPQYRKYSSNVPATYTDDIYETDSSGAIIMETVNETTPGGELFTYSKPKKLLHKKGDSVVDANGRIIAYDLSLNKFLDEDSFYTNLGYAMGEEPIFCAIQAADSIIFAGGKGRVCSFDLKLNKFYAYNSTPTHRSDFDSYGYSISGDGQAMGNTEDRIDNHGKFIPGERFDIRAIAYLDKELVVAGEKGRVASYDLRTGKWRKYDGDVINSTQDINAITNNIGIATDYNTIYSIAVTKTGEYIFSGAKGKVCSCKKIQKTIDNVNQISTRWTNWDEDVATSNNNFFNNGTAMGENCIWSSFIYNNSILVVSGENGAIASMNLDTREWIPYTATKGYFANRGTAMGGMTIYASKVVSDSLAVFAGSDGRVCSYNIKSKAWNNCNESEIASEGSVNNSKDIYDINLCGDLILFSGKDGVVCSYNTKLGSWNSIKGSVGIKDNGENTRGCIYATIVLDNYIIFAMGMGNAVFEHLKGEYEVDKQGHPVVDEPSKYMGILHGVPAYNRAFSIKARYPDIITGYNSLIKNTKNLTSALINGCIVTFGVKTTTGISSIYKFKNLRTGSEEFIDNIALSFYFGVKFNSNVLFEDQQYFVSLIKEKVIEYVHNLSGNTFSIYRMFDDIKKEYPSIDYFEFYNINNYSSEECQVIFKKDENIESEKNIETAESDNQIDEVLTIKYVIENYQNINLARDEDISLVPDILIKIL